MPDVNTHNEFNRVRSLFAMNIGRKILSVALGVLLCLTIFFVYAHINSLVSYQYEVKDYLGKELNHQQKAILHDVRWTKYAYIICGTLFFVLVAVRIKTTKESRHLFTRRPAIEFPFFKGARFQLQFKHTLIGVVSINAFAFPIASGTIELSLDSMHKQKELLNYIDFSIQYSEKLLGDKDALHDFIDQEESKHLLIIHSQEWSLISKNETKINILTPTFFQTNGINLRIQ